MSRIMAVTLFLILTVSFFAIGLAQSGSEGTAILFVLGVWGLTVVFFRQHAVFTRKEARVNARR